MDLRYYRLIRLQVLSTARISPPKKYSKTDVHVHLHNYLYVLITFAAHAHRGLTITYGSHHMQKIMYMYVCNSDYKVVGTKTGISDRA